MTSYFSDSKYTKKWGGLYVISQSGSKDETKAKMPYKIGLAIDFTHRLPLYLTYFPNGYKTLFILGLEHTQRMRSIALDSDGNEYETKSNVYLRVLFTEMEKKLKHELSEYKYPCIGPEKKPKNCEWYNADYKTLLNALIKVLKMYNGSELDDCLTGKKYKNGLFKIMAWIPIKDLPKTIQQDKTLRITKNKKDPKSCLIGTTMSSGKTLSLTEESSKLLMTKKSAQPRVPLMKNLFTPAKRSPYFKAFPRGSAAAAISKYKQPKRKLY